MNGSALQPWVEQLSIMQQSVLLASIRAPDGMRKDHPVKVLMRWYRRCILRSAFEGGILSDPFEPGGGSFTGPFTINHARDMVRTEWYHTEAAEKLIKTHWDQNPWDVFDRSRLTYLRYVDEMPHHFQLHFMHAAQIVGYKHDNPETAAWWLAFYLMIVNDAHLFPESEALMDQRLSDTEAGWRAREEVTAR